MTKVLKYLKVSVVPIFFVVILLFIQAYCDLALPQYMSNIVNVGIQQGGISSVIPEKITSDDLDDLTLFMTDEQKSLVEQCYTPNDGVYSLKENLDEEKTEDLENALTDPELITVMLSMAQNGDIDAENEAYNASGELTNALKNLPEGADFCDMLRMMPEE